MTDTNLPKASIPLKDFSDYFFENVATGYDNQLQITSKCNAKCMFCSNEQNPFEVKRCAFRDIREIEKVVWAMPFNLNTPISLNESLPGRISEGEAFIHPKFFEILEIIRRKFPFLLIKITTNASKLTPEFIDKLKNFNPLEISISTTSITKEFWKKSYNLTDKHYDIAYNSYKLLKENNIAVTVNLVPMPSLVGWNDLEKTIKFYAPSFFYIYGPGYTKYTKGDLSKFEYDKMELSLFLERMSYRYGFIYEWPLNPRAPLELDHKNLFHTMKNFVVNGRKNFLWLSSVAARERFEKVINSLAVGLPVKNNVIDVKNHTYGGNIEVAGLLVLKDVEKTLNEYLKSNEKPDIVFIPRIFLDRFGFDLSGDNVNDFFKKYNQFFYVL